MSQQEKTSRGLKKANRFLAAVRSSIGENIPAQLAHTFIIVADNEGKSMGELATIVGATSPTMSRHLLELSDKNRYGGGGYGLLQRTQNPTNLRSVIYTLTPKGRLLANQLADILED